ncbi:HD-domain/PDEase-like protein [Neoconidiobolus thromboides FSU 785]|nr:HD-domain/PDEase-like protein [Neoconidiobolus thromboides FSU 785]
MSTIDLTSDQLDAAWDTFNTIISGDEEAIQLDLNFNAWNLNTGDLCGTVLAIFEKLELINYIGSTKEEILAFIADVEKGYFCNPYHSFLHAVDVCAMLYYFLVDLNIKNYLDQPSVLALIIAGLCHDIGHPGLNNLYQINARTELALAFEDISVLENHSCCLTGNLLAKHQLLRKGNSKCPLSVNNLEDMIVENILSTDMAHHFTLLEDLSHILDEWPSSPARSTIDANCKPESNNELNIEEFRRKLCELLLHAADISNAVRPWSLCKSWSDMVVQEFFHQGDLEKRNSLPISCNMDRNVSSQPQIALDFDEFIVRPFFEILARLLPPCVVFLDNLEANRFRWSEVKKQRPHRRQDTASDNSPYSSRRVSFSAGTVEIPEFYCEELRRYSGDFIRTSKPRRSLSRPGSQTRYKQKREGCPPDKMNVLNSILQHSLSRIPSNDSLNGAMAFDASAPTVS